MTRQVARRTAWTLGSVFAIAAAVATAQSVLTQLGTTEAEASKHILDAIENGGYFHDPAVDAARRGFARIAPAARGPATTALYAWTRTHVNSPAFKTAYANMRTERKPFYEAPTTTPDQAAQAEINQKVSEMEEMAKSVRPMIPPADLAKWDAELKEQIAMLKGKQILDASRTQIAEKRAKDKADYDGAMKSWNTNVPADPNVRIAVILREFLAATTDVDFAARTKKELGEGGDFISFVNAEYNKKPWQWRVAFDFGPDVLAAARASASAWVNVLGGK